MSFLFGLILGALGAAIFLVVKNVVTPKEIVDSVDGNDQTGV